MTAIEQLKKVTVWLPGGREKIIIETGAKTFGELKASLSGKISSDRLTFENNKFIEAISKISFENDDAQLPSLVTNPDGSTSNALNLIIMPKQNVKSGATIEDSLELIRFYILQLGMPAKLYFRGYSKMTKATLERKLRNFTYTVLYKTYKNSTNYVNPSALPLIEEQPVIVPEAAPEQSSVEEQPVIVPETAPEQLSEPITIVVMSLEDIIKMQQFLQTMGNILSKYTTKAEEIDYEAIMAELRSTL